MYFKNQSNEEILNTCRIRIDNSITSPEIMAEVAKFGYDPPLLQHGKELLEEATSLHQKQVREYNEQYAATRHYEEAFTQAQDRYIDFVKVARVVFKDDADTYQQLGLLGKRNRLFAKWLPQVRQFYDEALGDQAILDALSGWGLTQEILQAGLQLVENAVKAHDKQVKESGEAQEATQERDAAIDALYDWTDDFQKVADIALKERPQLLEKIGILVKA